MRYAQAFPGDGRSVAAARRFTVGVLGDQPTETVEAVALMVSELATNCVRHVQASFELTIDVDSERIQVNVRDAEQGVPVMQSPDPDTSHGRGLAIVNLLSERWGVRHGATGKTVWFRVPLHDARLRSRSVA